MRLLTIALLAPVTAFASGFYMSENGSKTLMMGGAFAGQADDMSAMQHNPAGLAQMRGFNFLLDGQLVTHNITFRRLDPGFDPANPPATSLANEVNNSAPPFVVPMIGVGHGLKIFDRTLFIGLGLYGPPANGQYKFPAPNYETDAMMRYAENPRKFAPQRYSLIENYILVVFPTLSIAMEVIPKRFMLGVSLQPVLASFFFTQSVTSITRIGIRPMRQADEDPFFDSVVKVNLPMQYVNFTAVLGAMVRPTDWLQFGVSFRPQVMINARGNLDIALGQAATGLGTTVMGNTTSLSLRLPAELKLGVHVKPFPKLGINFDFIYQGWQSVQEIVVTPEDVFLKMGTAEPQRVAPFRIQKNWQAAYNFRLGGAYQLFPWLALHLGGWYETGAIPSEYIGVDFLHFSRFFLTGGVGLKVWKLEVLLGAAGSPSMTYSVPQSMVLAGSTEPEPAGYVGSGVYTSSNFMATLGIRGRFGGDDTPVERMPEPAPESPPQLEKKETAPAEKPAPPPAATEEAPK